MVRQHFLWVFSLAFYWGCSPSIKHFCFCLHYVLWCSRIVIGQPFWERLLFSVCDMWQSAFSVCYRQPKFCWCFFLDNIISWAEHVFGHDICLYLTTTLGLHFLDIFWDWNCWYSELVAHVYMLVITVFGFFVWMGLNFFSAHTLVIFFIFTQNMQKCISTKCNFVSFSE